MDKAEEPEIPKPPVQLDVDAVCTAQSFVDGKPGEPSIEFECVPGTLVSVL